MFLLEREIGVECRDGLLVEGRGVLRLGHHWRQVSLHELRRLQSQVGGLCRHGVVDDEKRAERHGLGYHEGRRQTDDGPAGGRRHGLVCKGKRSIPPPAEPGPGDPDDTDAHREKCGERWAEPVGWHLLTEGEKCRKPNARRKCDDRRDHGHPLEEPPQPASLRPRRGSRPRGRPEQA